MTRGPDPVLLLQGSRLPTPEPGWVYLCPHNTHTHARARTHVRTRTQPQGLSRAVPGPQGNHPEPGLGRLPWTSKLLRARVRRRSQSQTMTGITSAETTSLSQGRGRAQDTAGSGFLGQSACSQHGAKTAVSSGGRDRLHPDSSLPPVLPALEFPASRWARSTPPAWLCLPLGAEDGPSPTLLLTLSIPQRCLDSQSGLPTGNARVQDRRGGQTACS